MDPSTVVVMLTANLIGTGGLFYLIGQRMPARSGVMLWSAGSVLFGVAYVGRLASGQALGPAGDMFWDTAMILGAALLLVGLRQWVGESALRWHWLVGLVAAYALAHGLAVAWWGAVGRFTLLNLALALFYALIAAGSLWARGRQISALRLPLLVLTLLIGMLSLLTLLRGLVIAGEGIGAMYRGLAAQVYYAYASLAVVLLALNLLWMVFVRLNGQLQELASRDALTRVLNRNGLDDVLTRHFAARDVVPLSLLAVDVDHFKRINDRFGHSTGDQVLSALADTLVRHVRGNDFVARMGGEEFLVGCVGGDREMALGLGERLRAGVAAMLVPTPDGRGPVRCTVSVGVSTPFGALAERDRATREADHALYAAKAGGRNRVVASPPESAQVSESATKER
jgi:diguanylate cyclase (GGDEF)-like protein